MLGDGGVCVWGEYGEAEGGDEALDAPKVEGGVGAVKGRRDADCAELEV